MRPSERRSPSTVSLVLLRHDSQPVRPDDAAHHRRVAEQLLLGGWQQVDPCRDDPEHALGKPFDVPARGRACARTPRRRADCPAARSTTAPRSCSSAGSRPSSDSTRRAVSSGESGPSDTVSAFRLPPPQSGRRSSSSGRAHATTSSGTPLDEIDQAVDEVEEPVVGPLQVVDHEHERAPLGERLEEDAPAGEELRSTVAETDVFRARARRAARGSPRPSARSPSGTRSSAPRPRASPRSRARRRSRGSPPAP